MFHSAPECSSPGRPYVVFSPLPRTLQSVAPGSPPDDPVRGLVPRFMPPWMLQSGASLYRILSVASDAPVRGTRFTPGRYSPGAVLHAAPEAPFRGVWRVLCCVFGVLGLVAPVRRRAVCLFGVLCVVRGVLGHMAPVHRCACSVCCVVCVVWVWVCARVCHTVLVACFVAPKSRRRRCIHGSDTVGNAAANSPLAFQPTRRLASYRVLLILPVLDSLFLATPKSKRVLMHAWRCMLFTRWFAYSLYFCDAQE